MTRQEGWEDRYLAVLSRHAALPFSWDESNCFYLAMDVVEAVTGNDPWASERGCTSEDDFHSRLKRLGFADIADAFAAKLEETRPAFARRADLGVLELNGTQIAVVVTGQHAVGKAPAGTVRVPLGHLSKVFKVG